MGKQSPIFFDDRCRLAPRLPRKKMGPARSLRRRSRRSGTDTLTPQRTQAGVAGGKMHWPPRRPGIGSSCCERHGGPDAGDAPTDPCLLWRCTANPRQNTLAGCLSDPLWIPPFPKRPLCAFSEARENLGVETNLWDPCYQILMTHCRAGVDTRRDVLCWTQYVVIQR
jgi:hypothetical protein